jgi:hypothetical protein
MKNMKKIISLFSILLVLLLDSCIEQNSPIWEGAAIEFHDAVVGTPVPGQTFPRIAVANDVGAVSLQMNLVAEQRPNDEVINYRVVPEQTSAVQGTDFNAGSSFVIPANSSFGKVTIDVLNTGAIGGFVDVMIELEGNSRIIPSEKYKQVQLRITRPNPPEAD